MAPAAGPPPPGGQGAAAAISVCNAEVPSVCLIGATGAGKSSTGNTFFGCRDNDLFPVGDNLASFTDRTTQKVLGWRGGQGLVRCVDTPGMGDTEGRDREHIRGIAEVLQTEVQYVSVFLVLFNGQEPRLNSHLKEMLHNFKSMFGEAFLRNVMIGFTHWEYDRRATIKRKKSGGTAERKAQLMNEELRRHLGHNFDCPCVFLDNTLNVSTDAELKELFDDELQDIMLEFEGELEKVIGFIRRRQPFWCRDVKAVATEKEQLKEKVIRLIQIVDESKLGRKLILAEQGIIHSGWLRWHRQWLWGVLRRQHLRCFRTGVEGAEAMGPVLNLTGCICSASCEWQLLSRRPSFTVYRPAILNGGGGGHVERGSSYFSHVFQVEKESEQQKWVLFVQEATQLSESCHRIEKFHETLRVALSKAEYARAIAIVNSETMVIPVEWVLQHGPEGAKDHRIPTLSQAMKDVSRENVTVDGLEFHCPGGDELAAHIMSRVLEVAGHPDDEYAEVKAAVLSRDVLFSCSRTQGGGDTFEAVRLLFSNDDLVLVKPENRGTPVVVRVLRVESGEHGAMLHSIGPDTGVPQFQHDTSAHKLNVDMVRRMDFEGKQQLRTCPVDRDSWVPDSQMVQCMRCGGRFKPFLRRHHCRACGALVCYSCSRHFVPLATPLSLGTRSALGSFENMKEATAGSFQQRSPRGSDGGGSHGATEEAGGRGLQQQRVCFLCYQREVIRDLNARKERGVQNVFLEDFPDVSGIVTDEDSRETEGEALPELPGPAPGESVTSWHQSDEGSPWPAVSVEVGSTFKICSADQVTRSGLPETWFVVECRCVRVVRWNGLVDQGRIFISVNAV